MASESLDRHLKRFFANANHNSSVTSDKHGHVAAKDILGEKEKDKGNKRID